MCLLTPEVVPVVFEGDGLGWFELAFPGCSAEAVEAVPPVGPVVPVPPEGLSVVGHPGEIEACELFDFAFIGGFADVAQYGAANFQNYCFGVAVGDCDCAFEEHFSKAISIEPDSVGYAVKFLVHAGDGDVNGDG